MKNSTSSKKTSRKLELFSAPPGSADLAWIYCANNKNMPPPLTPMVVLTKTRNADAYTPVLGAHWKTSLSTFDIHYDKEPLWYVWEHKLEVQVVAWLYIKPCIQVSRQELEAFIANGVIIYGAEPQLGE